MLQYNVNILLIYGKTKRDRKARKNLEAKTIDRGF